MTLQCQKQGAGAHDKVAEYAPIRALRRLSPPGAGRDSEVSPFGNRPALVGGGAGLHE